MAEERRPAQPRGEQRRDRDTIGPRDLSGIPLEREERRDIIEAVRPTGGESMEARDFSSAVEAQREAEVLRGTIPGEDLEYQRRVQEERQRLQQMREDPGRWTVETEPGSGEYRPIRGQDIDVRERELGEYEAGYGEWRGSAMGGAEGLDRYAQEMYGAVEAGSSERGRAARDYEKAMKKWREQAYMPEAKPRDLEAPKAGSARLYEEAMRFSETDVEMLGGVLPVSSRGVRQIGAILEGSVEAATTRITGLIPGQQPFEVMPGEETVSWRRLPYEGLEDPTARRVAEISGGAAELGLLYAAHSAATQVVSAGLGTLGVSIGKLPFIGQRIASTAGAVAKAVNERRWLSSLLIGGPVVVGEGLKVKQLAEERTPLWKIGGELLMDVAAIAGTAHGFSRGLSFGKTIPGRLERLFRGGVTVPEASFVPEYVLEGTRRFPAFSEEPYPVTADGYKAMAESYFPKGSPFRITETGVPSIHGTTAPIMGDFTVMAGDDYAMYFAPGGSKHFLRLGGQSYSWWPGVPDIFGEPRWIYGEFTDVIATGFSKNVKAGSEAAALLDSLRGTGKLVMPGTGQLGEAQAWLSVGTEMVKASGTVWTKMGAGPVRALRFLPKTLAAAAGVDALPLTRGDLLAMSSAGRPSPSLYLPLGFLPLQGYSGSEPLPSLRRSYSRPGAPSYLPPSARPSSRLAPGSELLEPPRYAPPRYRPGPPSTVPPRKRPPSYRPPPKAPPSFTPPSRAPPSRPPYRPPTYKPPKAPPYRPPPTFRPPSRPPWGPEAMPRISPELGVLASRLRGFRGQRRTYPIRDPLSLAEDLMSPPPKSKGRRRRKGGDVFGVF